jgi:hypothetical protein
MRAPGAVQVLRSAQAVRQSRRPCPPPGQVRLHSASCCLQVLWHAAATVPRVAASARPTSPARTSAGRCDRLGSLLPCPARCQRWNKRAALSRSASDDSTAPSKPRASEPHTPPRAWTFAVEHANDQRPCTGRSVVASRTTLLADEHRRRCRGVRASGCVPRARPSRRQRGRRQSGCPRTAAACAAMRGASWWHFWWHLSTETPRNRPKRPESGCLAKSLVPHRFARLVRVGAHSSKSSPSGLTSRGSLVRSQYRPSLLKAHRFHRRPARPDDGARARCR